MKSRPWARVPSVTSGADRVSHRGQRARDRAASALSRPPGSDVGWPGPFGLQSWEKSMDPAWSERASRTNPVRMMPTCLYRQLWHVKPLNDRILVEIQWNIKATHWTTCFKVSFDPIFNFCMYVSLIYLFITAHKCVLRILYEIRYWSLC